MEKKKGVLVILSGPSGAGKGTVCHRVRQRVENIKYSISATTRQPRKIERDGREYFFLSREEFEEKIEKKQFLEWAVVYDNYYGTPKEYVEGLLDQGFDCILEIDPQGALQVKENNEDAIFIFIAPPSMEELRNRIVSRGTENRDEIEKRLGNAEKEFANLPKYDYVIINDDLEEAVNKVEAIMIAEKCKIKKNLAIMEIAK